MELEIWSVFLIIVLAALFWAPHLLPLLSNQVSSNGSITGGLNGGPEDSGSDADISSGDVGDRGEVGDYLGSFL